MRGDYKILKIILEIISSVIKRAVSPQLDLVQMATNKNILILDSQDTASVNTNTQQPSDSHYIVQVSDIDYLRRITDSSDGSRPGTEEDDEDDLLKQDVTNWDIFDDYKKFQMRSQRIKEFNTKQAR